MAFWRPSSRTAASRHSPTAIRSIQNVSGSPLAADELWNCVKIASIDADVLDIFRALRYDFDVSDRHDSTLVRSIDVLVVTEASGSIASTNNEYKSPAAMCGAPGA